MKTIRCSSLPALFACPASAHGDRSVTASHEAASAGTAAHEAMRAVVIGMEPDLDDLARKHAVDRDELGRLVWYGRKCWAELSSSFPDPETEVTVHAVGEGYKLSGHVDLVSYAPGRIHGLDWKTGRLDSDYFHQVAGYARCLFGMSDDSVKEVVITVVWVRAQEVETYRFDVASLTTWVADLVATLDRPNDFRTGRQCEYCPRSVDCSALMAVVRRDVEMFSAEEPGALLDGATPDQLIAVLRRAKVVAKFADGAEKLVRERIRQAGPLVGSDGTTLALVTEPGPRVVDTQKAWPILQARLTDEELAGCTKISITKACDAVAEKAVARGKGAAKKELSEALDAAGAITQGVVEKLRELRKPREIQTP
ncbi:MAG: DUF2800 domain-containing protein [Myxococcales bacterium]